MAKYLIDSTDIEIEVVSGTQNLKLNLASGNSVQTQLDNLSDYSTTETVIGTYDGKPLYRKICKGNFGNGSVLASDVDILVNCHGTAKIGSTVRYLPYYEYFSDNNNESIATVEWGIDRIYLNLKEFGISVSSTSVNVVIEYTKTTD